jgi:hypothetical protein
MTIIVKVETYRNIFLFIPFGIYFMLCFYIGDNFILEIKPFVLVLNLYQMDNIRQTAKLIEQQRSNLKEASGV